jgi:hypothetical protein
MTYASGGLIQATDYNNLINGSNQLNTVWNVGSGSAGYGQTAVSAVSASGTVTATQWASLVNTLNNARLHQSGAGSGISAPTAGTTIAWLSTLQTQVNSAYTNRLTAAATGTLATTTLTGYNITGGTGAFSGTKAMTFTWASGNAARYFFNCGGRIGWNITGVTNNNGTLRSADLVTNLGTNLKGGVMTNSASSYTGTGGGARTTNSYGYWNLTTSNQTGSLVYSSNYRYEYNSDYTYFQMKTSTVNVGGNGDNGLQITVTIGWDIPTTYVGLNDAVNVTMAWNGTYTPPATTYLSASWGAPTIAAV